MELNKQAKLVYGLGQGSQILCENSLTKVVRDMIKRCNAKQTMYDAHNYIVVTAKQSFYVIVSPISEKIHIYRDDEAKKYIATLSKTEVSLIPAVTQTEFDFIATVNKIFIGKKG
jgi:hypothetical protein